ncbi:uncharacterized protein LOC18013729 [Eutrema salsugineum]|nr:uncharacterized protein LOC18013729 [Eutrema salsugineum]
MTKWNVIMVIIMVMIAAAMRGEAKQRQRWTWIGCFRYCSRNCSDFDGNCYEGCKIRCGGPTPSKSNLR